MANTDFYNKYKFKLSRCNELDMDAHVIDEQIEDYVNQDVDLSSFRPQGELNPKVWVNGKISSFVRLRLLDIADDFISTLAISPREVIDIILTGSLANYNWSRYSDFDLHILVDFKKVDKRTDFVKDYFNSKKNEWNNAHEDLKLYGHPVELYVQDVNEEHTASGIYSLERNTWIHEPDARNIHAIKLDKYFIKEKVLKYMKAIHGLKKRIESENDDAQLRILSGKVKGLFDKIKGARKEGLKRSGECHPFNIIYKILRRNGYIDTLVELKTKPYDKLRSIE
jgi:predicted nucleotidyltransferase